MNFFLSVEKIFPNFFFKLTQSFLSCFSPRIETPHFFFQVVANITTPSLLIYTTTIIMDFSRHLPAWHTAWSMELKLLRLKNTPTASLQVVTNVLEKTIYWICRWGFSREIWGMWSTPSLLLLPCPLWPGVVVPFQIPSMDQIELFNRLVYFEPFNCVQKNHWYLIELLI